MLVATMPGLMLVYLNELPVAGAFRMSLYIRITVALARVLLPTLSKYKLNIVAKALNISLENHHRAVDDAEATAEIFVKFTEMLKKDQVGTLKEVNRYGDRNVNADSENADTSYYYFGEK